MNACVSIGGSEALTLKGALLVYQGQRRGFIAWHEVRRNPEGGAPFLGEAQELTTAFVHHLAEGLGTRAPLEILPENILARTAETIVWWTSATVRTLFFTARDSEAGKLTGKRFPQPPLVWKADGKDLWVRALKENRRPETGTPLMTAPYWNVDGETGWICQGTMRSPEHLSVETLSQWERAFFQSEFTHHTGARPLTNHPGGFFLLWLCAAESPDGFPLQYLAAANETLREFAARS